MLVGFSGKARHGKDTAAGAIEGAQRVAFADSLRRGMAAMFDLQDCHFSDRLKEEVVDALGASPRELMQAFGQAGRDLVPDLWCRVAFQRANRLLAEGRDVVMTDVRYRNEAEGIRARGGVVLQIVREDAPEISNPAHPSENGGVIPDAIIMNDGSVEELRAAVLHQLRHLRTRDT